MESRSGGDIANLLSRKRATVQGRKWRAQTQTGTYANFHQKLNGLKKKSLALSSSIVTVQMHVEMGTRGGGETWGNADGAFDCIMCALHGKFPFCFLGKVRGQPEKS